MTHTLAHPHWLLSDPDQLLARERAHSDGWRDRLSGTQDPPDPQTDGLAQSGAYWAGWNAAKRKSGQDKPAAPAA